MYLIINHNSRLTLPVKTLVVSCFKRECHELIHSIVFYYFQQSRVQELQEEHIAVDSHSAGHLRGGAARNEVRHLLRVAAVPERLPQRGAGHHALEHIAATDCRRSQCRTTSPPPPPPS